jgi:hypothetical protein
VPPVFITGFRLFNKPVPIGKNEILEQNIILTNEIDLKEAQNFFTFEFTTLNYRQTEKNKYQYKLEGFQDEWIDAAGERIASFTNLSPGEYVFRVRASYNDDICNMEGTAIKIIIIPPFYKTNWFIGIMILLGTSSIVGYNRHQKLKAKKQKAELERIINEKTNEVKIQSEEILAKSEQEKIVNWITKGLAYFGEIMSKHKGTPETLGKEVLTHLAKYVEASQGTLALAIKEDIQDVHLKIVAGYCVNKDRLIEKRIDVDQGLIGATYRDSKKQYLTNLPKDYIKVESGLGDVTPISLLLLPLKTDDGEMHGVVELAFLKEVSETTQTFLDKVMSVIALNIHAARINHQTQILLQKSKEQTEELMAQEEEMRQNMEEMEATQEEFSRREIEYQVKIQELGGSLK